MINFNAAPYFDDYDENKGFYKILFRPSVAVQARELNQMQTILQKQVSRFGSHIFKEGSIVLGGAFDLELDIAYVKATNVRRVVGGVTTVLNNLGQIREAFVGKNLIGDNSNVKAYVRAVDYDGDSNVYVFMVRYTAAAGVNTVFLDNENIYDEELSGYTFTSVNTASTGRGSIFSIEQGAMFFRGYFIAFPKQTIVLDPYSKTPTITVGMKLTESIVTEVEDETLLDNALGSYNENAPGAHRYKFDASLLKVPYGEGTEDPDFITLISLNDGIAEEYNERSEYSRVYEELAKRTYDESGDYYVRGLNVTTREHLNVRNNEGLYTAAQGGNSQLISIEVDPGLAYVKGYERNILTTKHVITEKSTDYAFVNESATNARSGGYVLVKEISGSPVLDTGATINLYDTAQTRITSALPINNALTGNIIGTARVKGVEYQSGQLGTANGTIRVYLYDINMTTQSFSSVKALSGTGFIADVILNTAGAPVVYDQNQNSLLFYVGSDHVRSLKNVSGSDTSFLFYRTADDRTIAFGTTTGVTNVTVSTTGETLAYATGTLGAAEKRELILSVKTAQEFQLPGTVSATGNTVTGVGTFFLDRLNVGDRVRIDVATYYIKSITNNTTMNLTTDVVGGAIVGPQPIFRSFLAGDVIDLTVKGSSGAERTASVSGGVLTIDIKEDISATVATPMQCRLSYRVLRSAGAEIKKTLKQNVYVQVNCAALANRSAPIPLGFPDVYKINEIRRKSDNTLFSNNSQGSVVTSNFVFDNGQRDNIYDHAKITPGGGISLSTSDRLLVSMDIFESEFSGGGSGGFGYFSIDSYPVDDDPTEQGGNQPNTIFTYEIPIYKSATGVDYNLRNYMDFRPYKQATATSSLTVAGATVNPSYSPTGALKADLNGLRMPVPDSRINLDYSYYLARRDVVALDINGEFSLIKGQPSVSPVTPSIPDNVMGVAQVYISPYPSISEKLARILNLNDNICISNQIANIRYTMREIGVLKNRIENLEYYTALTLLEKSAVDLQIIDPLTKEDRFKNGFFVDGFLDHSLGATYSADYNIAVDKIEQSIRPVFEFDSFKFDLLTSESSGIQKTGDLVTLPYTETALIDQPNVTTIRNIEQSVYRFIGVMQLTPDGDVWCDTTTVDKTIEFGNGINVQNAMSTEYGSWQTYVTGYNLYDRSFGDRSGVAKPNQFIGSYTSYAAALAAAQKDKDGRFLIETVTTQQRTNVNTIVSTQTQTQELGSFVTSAALIPYIRPQVIRVLIQGMKANTRYYTFFDGEEMSNYITPFNIPENNILGAQISGTEGNPWISDEYGNLLALLRLPAEDKRFRTGTKEIIVTDSPTNAIDATSYSKGYFTAQGLAVQKQNTILSTKTAVTTQEEVIETGLKKQTTEIFGPSCMAYSFKVDVPPDEEGVFLTSVDVFIESMHPTLGVWFEIREMNSAGGITRNQVPYSEVWMKRNDPRIVLNPFDPNRDYTQRPLIPTKVNFPSPVFLYNNTQYAFVIHTEGLNPQTYFYVSRLGETDLRNGTQVTSRRLTGNLFTTNNNLNYDLVPDVDLTVRFNRAQFATQSGTVMLGNKPLEFFEIENISGQFNRIGEKIYGGNKITLSNLVTTGNTISVNDKFVGESSGVISAIKAIDGFNYYVDAFSYINNETVSVRDASNVSKNITATIATLTRGEGTLRNYDMNKNVMVLEDSNGLFYANAKVIGELSSHNANLRAFTNYPYSTTNLKPHYLKFSKTDILFEMRGFASTGNFTDYYPGNPDSSTESDVELMIMSRAVELSSLNGQRTSKVRALMSSSSNYVSPVIDVSRANSVYVHNIINNSDTNETLPSGGNLINKYISKTVTLADGQDAEDLLVKLTAYRPAGTTVKVWMKIRHAQDGEIFDQKPWVEMNYTDGFSSSANKNNFVELTYTVKPENLDANGIVFYNSNGINYSGFKQFAIKIGLMGLDSAVVPRVGDLRAIALQK